MHVELGPTRSIAALTFAPDGTLYVSDPAGHELHRCQAGDCAAVAGPWHRPYGLATLADGTVCVAHYDSDDPLMRRTTVSCRDGADWRTEVTAVGQGVNGLAPAARGGLWVAAWLDSDALSRDGQLLHVVTGVVRRRISLPERVPAFLVELPGGDLLVSTWREDASGVTGGDIVRVDAEGNARPFSESLGRPSGLAVNSDGVWAADHDAGSLVFFPPGGEGVTVHRGLDAPLGLAFRNATTLCVAESGPGRVTCLETPPMLEDH